MTGADDWKRAWDPMVAAVGRDFGNGEVQWGADVVERGAIRRYCEPLELGSALHHDPEVARAHGHADVTVPYTGAVSWTIPALWRPGDPPLFDDAARDAQPARSPINNSDPGPAPRTSGFFATDMEMDFLRPAVAGERLGTRGRRLVSCEVKETSVGRGAFLTFETEIVSDAGDVIARMRTGAYAYDPHSSEVRG
jgi:hypothetical protein